MLGLNLTLGLAQRQIGGPSLNLNFLAGELLDPRITFTRASNATVTGSDGVLKYAPHNLLTFSESFDNAVWVKNATITANTTTAPDGTTTADTITATAASQNVQQTLTYGDGGNATFSVFLKRKTGTGAVSISHTIFGSVTDVAVTNDWQRFSVTTTLANGSRSVGIRLATSGDEVYVWGAQLNVGPLQPYYPTTVKNLLGYTQEFDNAAWTKSNATVTANATTAPDGSLTADLLEKTATAFASVVQGGVSTALATQTGSVYVKSNGTLSRVSLALVNSNSATLIARGVIDLTTGAITNFTGSGLLPAVNVGDGWWRVAIQGAAVDTSTRFLVYPDQHNFAVAGGIYIWGAQLSDSASLDPYVYNPEAAPVSTAYYGPRFDYDPVTLQPKGLLIEEQRTNLLTFSEQFDNASWTKSATTVTANAAVSPDGTQDAPKLVETTANSQHSVSQAATITAGAQVTGSCYIKAGERTTGWVQINNLTFTTGFRAAFNLSTNSVTSAVFGTGTDATVTITAVGSGWFRITATGVVDASSTSATLSVFLNNGASYAGDGTSGLFLWGAQLEAGAFPTSYIPTTTAAATRAADVAVMTGDNFASWYRQDEGTVYADASSPLAAGCIATFMRSGSSFGPRIQLSLNGVGNSFGAVVDNANSVVVTLIRTGLKSAFAFKTDDYAISANGSAVLTDMVGGLPSDLAQLRLGIDPVGGTLVNGHLRRIAYWPRRLSNAELQGVTS